jgi:hypothetical protein
MGEGVRLYDPLEPFDWRDARALSDEQREILAIFTEMLRGPTADGGNKRARGTKAHWKDDPTHEEAAWRHANRKLDGDVYDEDSGYHAYIHAAWRLLAVAYQEGARLSDRKEATSLRASDGE